MLKLSDPFEMDDLGFVGIFYNAETEAIGSQKSNQRLGRLDRRVRVLWRKLLRAFEGMREAVMRHASRNLPEYSLVREKAVGLVNRWRKFEALMSKDFQLHTQEETPSETLQPEFHHLDTASNENAASELRPLSEDEKRQFLNSLNEDGRRILAELTGKSEKGRSRRSVAPVAKPNPVSIAPDIGTFDKGIVHNVDPPMT